MAIVDLVMPKMGESITEATIINWLKSVGDYVEAEETILEVATDKVDSEVPSTTAGVIEEILFNENDVVPIGTVIAKIRVGADTAVTAAPAQPATITGNAAVCAGTAQAYSVAAVSGATSYTWSLPSG